MIAAEALTAATDPRPDVLVCKKTLMWRLGQRGGDSVPSSVSTSGFRWGAPSSSSGAGSSCSCKAPVLRQTMKGVWKLSITRLPSRPHPWESFPVSPLLAWPPVIYLPIHPAAQTSWHTHTHTPDPKGKKKDLRCILSSFFKFLSPLPATSFAVEKLKDFRDCHGSPTVVEMLCGLQRFQVPVSPRSHQILLESAVRSYEVFCRPYETRCVVLDRRCDVWSASRMWC